MPTVPSEIFKAYDIRGIVGKTLTPEVAELIGRPGIALYDDVSFLLLRDALKAKLSLFVVFAILRSAAGK